jgi:TolB-like protein/Tfp pilus assembly protein PilF
VTEPPHAVFLSYASQDAQPAQRICEALRLAGIEVFLDQSELRGGDVWDRKIRWEIQNCLLFIPIISQHTQKRLEGYFRHEWMLAAERTHRIAEQKPFLVPVVTDETPESDAIVPDPFKAVQWTRLPGGDASSSFVERIQHLLSAETAEPNYSRAPAGLPRASPPAGTHVFRPSRGARGIGFSIVLALLVVAAGGLLWRWERLYPPGSARALSFRNNPRRSVALRNTVAVLPFEDLSENGNQTYFAEGVAQELAGQLGKIPGMRVIGTTSSFQFKGRQAQPRLIGEKLGAAYLVQGSVLRAGDLVRVNVELTDARKGIMRWSASYDRKVTDVLQLQDEIAASVARSLQITVDADRVARASLKNPRAYDLYLQGLHALDDGSQEAIMEAVADFQQSLKIEPYDPAAAGLAWAFVYAGDEGWLAPRKAFEQARGAAQLALRLDPSLADAHAALGEVHLLYDWDWAAASNEARRAQGLGSQVLALQLAGQVAAVRQRWGQARQLFQSALAIDPLNPSLYELLTFTVYLRAGQYTEAESAMRRVLQISPRYGNARYFLGESLLLEGRLQAALAEFQQETGEDGRYEGSAMVYYAMGRKSESDAALRAGIAENGESWPSEEARVYAYRGNLNRAMQWLERAYASRDEDLYAIESDPLVHKLEHDPRYRAFLSKMKFPK